MQPKILFSEDPAFVLCRSGLFFSSQPILHNLVLSILHARVAHGDAGRYWMAVRGDDTLGVVVQSPVTYPAILTPMETRVATAMADAIVEAGFTLPGITADAATAATFAGQWSERFQIGSHDFSRAATLRTFRDRRSSAKRRYAAAGGAKERSLMIDWTRAFQHEIDEPDDNTELLVDRGLVSGRRTVGSGPRWRNGFYGR